ncbi:MAG: hypothetical protein HYR79_03230 [Nitrospirae bacterium]|nr:hypothetical protein [Nitrospirota bacterium]
MTVSPTPAMSPFRSHQALSRGSPRFTKGLRRGIVFFPLLLLFFLDIRIVPAFGEIDGRSLIVTRCGKCHGITLEGQCLSGECEGGRSHPITRRPWDLVIPWMRAMGCEMTDTEQKKLTEHLMLHYGISYSIRWERTGNVPGGWNVVALGAFRHRLFAGIEGNGSIFEFGEDSTWKPALTTSNYTVYGLIPFQNRLYGVTNDPAAEIWSSADGKRWHLSARLPEEKGATSLGVYKGVLYAGTTRASLYRSSNGTSWTRVSDLIPNAGADFTHWVRFILPFDGALYAGIEKGGLYRSEDGMTWKRLWPSGGDRPQEKYFQGVRGAAFFNRALYVGTTGGGEIFKFELAGGAPTRVFSADPKTTRGYIGSMAVLNKFLYAAVGGVIFRTGDGDRWKEVGQLGPFTIEAMTVFDKHLYAGTTLPPNAWIYRTTGNDSKTDFDLPAGGSKK